MWWEITNTIVYNSTSLIYKYKEIRAIPKIVTPNNVAKSKPKYITIHNHNTIVTPTDRWAINICLYDSHWLWILCVVVSNLLLDIIIAIRIVHNTNTISNIDIDSSAKILSVCAGDSHESVYEKKKITAIIAIARRWYLCFM